MGILIIALYIVAICFVFFTIKNKQNTHAIICILIIGCILRCILSTDLFLHEWDERFHAVVSKNILEHPLKPTLYDKPLIDYDHKVWASNHVWLSKPPLTFWIIGASLKVFGINEIGLRLPSILLSLLSVFLTIKIGTQLFGHRVGVLAGFFHAIHGLALELTGGLLSADHVDVLFLTLFQTGIFLLIRYLKYTKRSDLFWIGIIAGLAFLCKWVMCFFLLLICFIAHYLVLKNIRQLIRDTLTLLVLFLIIGLPWCVYIYVNYPTESTWIFQQIFAPILPQESGRSPFFYIDYIRIIFGELIYIPMIWMLFKMKAKRRINLIILAVWIFLPLVLLSLCGFKKDTYLMMSAPAFFLLTAIFISYFYSIIKKININKYLAFVFLALLILLPVRYSIERIKPFKARLVTPEWKTYLIEFDKKLLVSSNKIVLTNEPHHMNAMFYFDYIAYERKLNVKQIENIKEQGYRVYENQDGIYVEK